jgi:hypothetical protein
MQVPVKFATIAQSATVSDAVDVTGVKTLGVWIPVVTSGQLLLRGSFDQTSANFVPVFAPNASPIASRWFANIGPGSATLAIDLAAAPFPFVKLETTVAQAAVRSLALVCKLG